MTRQGKAMSPGQRRATGFAAAGGFIDGFDLLLLSAALIVITPFFDLSPSEVGTLVAAAYLGSWLGTAVFGYYTDRYGRRAVFVLNMAVFVVTALMCALAPSYGVLLVSRFLIGVAIGMDLPTAGAMIAEFAPAARRGRLLAVWQLLWAIGAVCAPVVMVLMLPLGESSWRYALASGALPALIILIGRRQVPETPRWLLSQGRREEARKAMDWAGMDARELMDDAGDAPASALTLREALREIFGPRHRRNVLVLSAACFAGAFGPLFLGTYVAYLAKYYGFTSDVEALLFGTVTWLFFIVGNVINIAFTDRVGRKPFMVGGGVLVTLSLLAASQIDIAAGVGLVIAVLTVAALGHWGGVDQGLWQYSTELFPTRIRATARGLTTSWIRLSAFLSAIVTPVMLDHFGFGTTMLLFSGMELVLVACALGLPEVSNRSLEEIDGTASAARPAAEDTAPAR